MTLPSWASPVIGLIQKVHSGRCEVIRRILGQACRKPAERRQHLSGMARIEEIDERDVLTFEQVGSPGRS